MTGPAVRFVASGGTPAVESDFGAPITETVSGAPFTLVDKGGVNVRGPARYRVGANNPKLVLDFANGIYRTGGATVGGFSDVVDFSRTGLATVTDRDGVIKWAPHNLMPYSNTFDGWNKTDVTVVNNVATAPDGSMTASSLSYDTTTTGIFVEFLTVAAGADHTFGVWFKNVDSNWLRVVVEGVSSWIDLSDGSLGTDNVGLEITPFDDGWFLLRGSNSSTDASFQLNILLADADGSVTEDAGTSIYLWGAHLYRSDLGGMQDVPSEERKVSATYLPTTSAARYLPRFDHNPATLAPLGLLVEESRTNLLPYSEAFDNAAWTKARISVSATDEAAPDGTDTAHRLIEDTSTGTHTFVDSVTITAGSAITYTIYAKSAGRDILQVNLSSGSNIAFAKWDLSDGTIQTGGSIASGSDFSNPLASITDAGNGWYRCRLSTDTAVVTAISISNFLNNDTPTSGYTGDGTSGMIFWGAQLEAGSFPTSYIPTTGSAATRAAETASIASANLPYSSTAMSIAMDGDVSYADNDDFNEIQFVSWQDDASNFIRIRLDTGSTNTGQIDILQVSGGVSDQVQSAADLLSPGTSIPFSLSSRNVSTAVNIAINGSALTANTTPSSLPDLSATDLDFLLDFNGHIKTFRMWDVDLGDAGIEDASS